MAASFSGTLRTIAVRYWAALILLLALGLVQFAVLYQLDVEHRAQDEVIRLVDEQRTSSQRIALLATQIVTTTDPALRVAKRVELSQAAQVMLAADDQLRTDAASPGADASTVKLHEMYFTGPYVLDVRVKEFVRRGVSVAATPDRSLSSQDSNVRYLAGNATGLLTDFNHVIETYDVYVTARRHLLQIVAAGALASLLIVLVLVLLLIFRPMEARIAAQQRRLLRDNENLRAVVDGSRLLAQTLDPAQMMKHFMVALREVAGPHVEFYEDNLEKRTGDAIPVQEAPATLRPLIERARTSGTCEVDRARRHLAVPLSARGGEPHRFAAGHVALGVHIGESERFAIELLLQQRALAEHNCRLFADLEAREHTVEDLNKLKSDLIAMLAHDFRSPLTSIIGFAELLQEGVLEGEEAVDAAATILRAANRLNALAADTLTMAQLERNELTLRRESLDVVDLVAEIVHAHENERQIAFTAPPDAVVVDADRNRLRQVFDNVVANAIKYSPDGEPVQIVMALQDGAVVTTISDRGIGIVPDETEFIFQRFARGSNARKTGISGSGFGLYLSKMLIELQGGSISVISTPGEGSTFTITLPVIAPTLALTGVSTANGRTDTA